MDSYLGGLNNRLHKHGVWEKFTLHALSSDFGLYQRKWEKAVKAGECPYAAFYRVFTGRPDAEYAPSRSVAGGAPNAPGSPQPQPSPEPPGEQPRPPEAGLPELCGGLPGG